MGIGAKFRGIRELWRFDNRYYLIVSRIFFPAQSTHIYKFRGLEFLTDHSAGDANGARDLLVSDMYRSHLRKLQLSNEVNVLDIGANNGGFPLLLASEGFKFKRLISIELNPRTFKRLDFNIKRNFGPEATSLNAALCGECRTITFSPGHAGTSDNIYAKANDKNAGAVDVAGITLDQAIGEFDEKIDICKIDIEGAEFEVFESNNVSKIERVKFLLIEIHHEEGRHRDIVRDRLNELGFEEIDPPQNDNGHYVHLFRHSRI